MSKLIVQSKLIPTVDTQKGVALLTVLLLVVSITVLAGSMLASQKITTRKSSLLFKQNKLLQQVKTGENLAIEVIRTDEKLNDFDSFQDIWAKEMPPFSNGDGYVIEFEIKDASARFNLNNLYHDGVVDEQALASFERLLASLGLDTQLARTVLDWQDPDSEVYQDTADEVMIYKSTDGRSISIANQPFISIDQLADLPDVTADTIAVLRPYVTAVPYWLPINANTADEVILQALIGEGDGAKLQSLLKQRQTQPFESNESVKSLALFAQSQSETNQNQVDQKKSEPSADEDSQTKGSDKSKEDEKIIAQKEAMLDVKSRAFDVLVIASDTKTQPARVRYATLKVAKGMLYNPKRTQINEQNNHQNEDNQIIIQAFSERMWAFRPPF